MSNYSESNPSEVNRMEASSVLWKETKDRVATNSNAQVYWYKIFFVCGRVHTLRRQFFS